MKNNFEQVIHERLQMDVCEVFSSHHLSFIDTNDIKLDPIKDYLVTVAKVAVSISKMPDSVSLLREYVKLFALFNIDYVKSCFFEPESAGDRVSYSVIFSILFCNFHLLVNSYNKMSISADDGFF